MENTVFKRDDKLHLKLADVTERFEENYKHDYLKTSIKFDGKNQYL